MPRRLTNTRRLALLGGALLFAALPALADTKFSAPVEQVEFGVICDYRPQGQEVEAPDTNAGRVRRGGDPITFDLATDQVPGILGTAFGIRMLASDDIGRQTVTMVTRHPSFGPGYQDSESWTSTLAGGVFSARYFFFEFQYEIAPGPWVMEVWLEDQLIIQQDFTVHTGAAARAIMDKCPTDGFMS